MEGLWGAGGEYAYELLDRIDDRHVLGEIRDALAATYGPVSLELLDEYVDGLERIGVVESGLGAP